MPELDPSLAELYLQYGNCLILTSLTNEQAGDASSDDEAVLASAVGKMTLSEPGASQSTETPPESIGDVSLETLKADAAHTDVKEAEEGSAVLDTAEDLDIAWDVLEVARILFEQQPAKRSQLAEVHVRLGEVSLYFKRFRYAASDLEVGLSILLGLETCEPRRLAEARYLAGYSYFLSARKVTEQDDPREKSDGGSTEPGPEQLGFAAAAEKAAQHFVEATVLLENELLVLQRAEDFEAEASLRETLQDVLRLRAELDHLVEFERKPQQDNLCMHQQ